MIDFILAATPWILLALSIVLVLTHKINGIVLLYGILFGVFVHFFIKIDLGLCMTLSMFIFVLVKRKSTT